MVNFLIRIHVSINYFTRTFCFYISGISEPNLLNYFIDTLERINLRYFARLIVKTGVLDWHQSVLIEDHTLRC